VPLERRDDRREVLNYIEAVNTAVNRLAALPLSTRLLREAHAILMQGVRGEHKQPGEFRKSQNWIGGSSLSNAVYIPPHQDSVPELMSDLERFWHNENITVPHIIRIAISHYQFESIHPFLDGNGRVGRLMVPLYLVERKLLSKPSLYLSAFFEKNRSAYYDALERVRTHNDLIHWVRFFLTGVMETATRGRDVFKGILALRESTERQVYTLGRRATNAKAALEFLYKQPLVDAAMLEQKMGIARSTAQTLIADLTKLGILMETTGRQRGRMFVFDRYLKLFAG
jgi:Fic family protein